MTHCIDCERDLNRFNPTCLPCGGRYLRDVQKQRLPAEQKRSWLRQVLADWLTFGHDEQQLRGLAAKKP